MTDDLGPRVVATTDAAGRTVEHAFTSPDAAADYLRARISGHAAGTHRYRVLLARVDVLAVDGGRLEGLPDGISMTIRASTPSDLVLAVPGMKHPKPSYAYSADEAVAYFNEWVDVPASEEENA